MKIKKEYLLLALLIASSIGYLIFQKTDRLHYTLPVLNTVKAEEITSIEVTHEGKTTVLTKKDSDWIISPQNWRADGTKVSEMLDTISRLAVTDLVSESGDYERYQLDEKGRAVLKVYAGKNLLRELTVGKAAPTYNHTYVMLPGEKGVYLAAGDLPRLFLVPQSELRDMVVFSVTPADITRIEIERKGKRSVLVKTESTEEKADDKTKLFVWKKDSGATIDKAEVDAFLAGLSKVYCGEYLDDAAKEQMTSPEITIMMKGAGENRLSIFPKEGDKLPALSSQNDSPFLLPDYKYEEIEKFLNKALEN